METKWRKYWNFHQYEWKHYSDYCATQDIEGCKHLIDKMMKYLEVTDNIGTDAHEAGLYAAKYGLVDVCEYIKESLEKVGDEEHLDQAYEGMLWAGAVHGHFEICKKVRDWGCRDFYGLYRAGDIWTDKTYAKKYLMKKAKKWAKAANGIYRHKENWEF
jgi:hypothetical protein